MCAGCSSFPQHLCFQRAPPLGFQGKNQRRAGAQTRGASSPGEIISPARAALRGARRAQRGPAGTCGVLRGCPGAEARRRLGSTAAHPNAIRTRSSGCRRLSLRSRHHLNVGRGVDARARCRNSQLPADPGYRQMTEFASRLQLVAPRVLMVS